MCKLGAAIGLMCLSATLAWAASATADIEPDGWNDGCKFNDDNGMLLDTIGADATWANSVGVLESDEPAATKSARGGPVDCKYFDGRIDGAEQPAWVVELEATSKVEVAGWRGGNFNRPISCVAKSELVVFGDLYHFAATERQLSDTATEGYYDIAVLVGGITEVVSNGGRSSHLGVYPTPQIRTDWTIFTHSGTVAGALCEFSYRSTVYTFMEIDFTTPGNELVSVEVDQEGEKPWSGLAKAYDGSVQITQFLLD